MSIEEAVPEHSLLSPSGSSTWLRCAGSIEAQQDMPNTSSIFAAEGSVAHELASWALINSDDPCARLDEVWVHDSFEVEIDMEMVEYVRGYIKYCKLLTHNYDPEDVALAVEKRVFTTIDECHGTADYMAYIYSVKTLHVVDLKYGKGVTVRAANNTQLLIYGWGAALQALKFTGFMPESMTLHIYQPRLGNYDTVTYTRAEFEPLIAEIERRALLALQPNAPRNAGEKQCQWCRAKVECPEFNNHVNSTIYEEFPIAVIEADNALGTDLANALSKVDMAKAWIKAVEAAAFERLESGREVDGYKLVRGRGSRQWVCPAEDLKPLLRERKLLVREITKVEMLSVAQLEKKFGKKKFAEKFGDLVINKEGKPALAIETDKRVEYQPSDQFEKLN